MQREINDDFAHILKDNIKQDIVSIILHVLDRHKVTYGQNTTIKYIELGWTEYADVVDSQFTDRRIQFWKDGRICCVHGNDIIPLYVVEKEEHLVLCWKEQFEGQKENPIPFPVVCGRGFD